MDKLKRINQTMQTMSLAGSIVAAQQATQWAGNQLPRLLLPVVALVIVGLGRHIFQYLFESMFHIRWLRRRLLGRQFIEGSWFIIFRVGGKPVRVGETRIEPDGASMRFTGEDFAVEAGEQGDYSKGSYSTTDLVILDWPRIKYNYKYNLDGKLSEGYGEAQFFEGDDFTQKYSGHFRELLGKRATSYEGWRVDANNTKIRDRLKKPETQRAAVMEFFKETLDLEMPKHAQPPAGDAKVDNRATGGDTRGQGGIPTDDPP